MERLVSLPFSIGLLWILLLLPFCQSVQKDYRNYRLLKIWPNNEDRRSIIGALQGSKYRECGVCQSYGM